MAMTTTTKPANYVIARGELFETILGTTDASLDFQTSQQHHTKSAGIVLFGRVQSVSIHLALLTLISVNVRRSTKRQRKSGVVFVLDFVEWMVHVLGNVVAISLTKE